MTQDDTPETEDAPTTLGELNHTNPFTGEAFGATQTYDRGHTVAADGGEAGRRPSSEGGSDDGEAGADASDDATADEEADAEDDDPEELRDIEHTPPGDAEGTNAVYERGNEGREEHR